MKRQIRKTWFLEIVNVVFHVQVCLINVTESLENGRKEIMGIILQQYMFRMLFVNCLLLSATMVWISEVQLKGIKGISGLQRYRRFA